MNKAQLEAISDALDPIRQSLSTIEQTLTSDAGPVSCRVLFALSHSVRSAYAAVAAAYWTAREASRQFGPDTD